MNNSTHELMPIFDRRQTLQKGRLQQHYYCKQARVTAIVSISWNFMTVWFVQAPTKPSVPAYLG
jgi:hypothetical protein